MNPASVDKEIRELVDGAIGYFWDLDRQPFLDELTAERGHAQIKDGWVNVDLLEEDVLNFGSPGLPPRGLAGALAGRNVFLLEIVGPYGTRRFGSGASSKRYRARTALAGVRLDRIRNSSVLSLRADFPALNWTQLAPLTEKILTTGKRPTVRGWDFSLRKVPSLQHKLTGGRTLELSAQWSVNGPSGHRIIGSKLGVTCSSAKPREFWHLLEPILQVQDLLSFAYDRYVTATSGGAILDLQPLPAGARQPNPAALWNGALMTLPPGAQSIEGESRVAAFDLEDLGGIRGVARWIQNCQTHPRATSPVVGPMRMGDSSAPVRLMEVAAGLEYWVSIHKGTQWAKVRPQSKAVASRSAPFRTWVGDWEPWANRFWKMYTDIKHNPKVLLDHSVVESLAESGALLLAAVLLERAAGTRKPAERLFQLRNTSGILSRLQDP